MIIPGYTCPTSFGKVSPMFVPTSLSIFVVILPLTAIISGCSENATPVEQAAQAETAGLDESRDPETIAKQTVAEFLKVADTDVTVVSMEKRQFNDSSLDCPQPGMSYLQAITPGYRIIAEADGRRFDVRVSAGHGRICRRKKPNRSTSMETANPPRASDLIGLAQSDLANQLNAPVDEISVAEVKPFIAGNPVDGCQPACNNPGQQCGFLISFFHDGRHYQYHANDGIAEPCPLILTR